MAVGTPIDTSLAIPTTSPSTTSPKKRRRRTTAAGAADDCFACQENHDSCDRRRPYCTQCLERGKTCSGYKTTLTWGVGVASRGKLRGLSLPVSKENQKSNNSAIKKEPYPVRKPSSDDTVKSKPTKTRPTKFDFVPVDPILQAPRSTPNPQRESQWLPEQHTTQPREIPDVNPAKRPNHGLSLQTLSMPTPTNSYTQSPTSMIASAMPYSPFEPFGTLPSTPGYDSPSDQPAVQRYFPNPLAWNGTFTTHNYSQPSDPYALSPTMTTASTSLPRSVIDLDGFDTSVTVSDFDDIEEIERRDSNISLRALYGLPNAQVGSTKGLRELINYFDHVISPVIVAFESSRNPYRSHILPLAANSPALQHAIAALSASNLRIRRDHEQAFNTARLALTDSSTDGLHDASVRKSSIAHSVLRATLGEAPSTVPGQPSPREKYHKGESIKALNANLADVTMREDDSVLATLLILCLYHLCDTGVAKFKTQFAGVKRILNLRSRRSTTSESRWIITMFRWFDAMAATVNDREGQFDEENVEDESLLPDEWALENLAGCDSRLFNIISRLGRLNLLSQGRPVFGTTQTRALPVRNSSFDGISYRNMDGNGWTSFDPMESESSSTSTSQFWTEFSSVRQELADWQFQPLMNPTGIFPHDELEASPNNLDIYNISEAFRHAALLYTERLGNPHAPASTKTFQSLVQSTLHYIDAVQSDVYLLWPLFIAGTECVLEEHRDHIRKRCMSIQGDSGFFNNTSALRILEEVWRNNDETAANHNHPAHGNVYGSLNAYSSEGPLRWRKAMMHTAMDGEYIVV